MQLEKKHIVLIAGSVLILSAVGIGLYLIFRKDPNKEDPTENEDSPKKNKNTAPKGNTSTSSSPVLNQDYATPLPQNTAQTGKIVPLFNQEKELNNPLSELKGKVLYAKRKYLGGLDYANVRSSAEVNTASAWYDPLDNLLTTINAGIPIGKVVSETAGVYNSYSYRWFKIKLIKPVGFWGTEVGYVRADTVTFVPYSK